MTSVIQGLIQEKAIELLQRDSSLTLTEVGKRLNQSREWVRQIADDIPGASRHRKKRCCVVCGMWIVLWHNTGAYKQGYCLSCWLVEKERRQRKHRIKYICEICGKDFYGLLSEHKRRIKDKSPLPKYCSRVCYGKWAGITYGWGTPNNPAGKNGKKRKWDYGEVYALADKTEWGCKRLGYALGIPYQTIGWILNKRKQELV